MLKAKRSRDCDPSVGLLPLLEAASIFSTVRDGFSLAFSFASEQDRSAGFLSGRVTMPNGFAYIMLFAWPFVALALFRTLPVHKALIWTILGGHLILPSATGIKLPMIPMLDKHSVAVLSAFVLCQIYAPRRSAVPGNAQAQPKAANGALVTILLAVLIGSPFLTVMMNPDPIIVGPRFIPGLRLYDAFSIIAGIAISVLPFFLARRHLNTPEAHREILRALVFGGLAYSLLALIEVRLSPQLHVWVYGFFPHDFIQHIRAGGFRPVVFLNHGLMVGIFFCLSVLASLVLWRTARREGTPAFRWLCAALWLMVTLVLAKSVGALVITLAMGLVIGIGGKRLQLMAAVVVVGIVLLYPFLRGAGFIPVDSIYDIAMSYSEDRAQSLKFRLDNEDALLAHANERPIWGWGSWGRNQLYDPDTGRMVSVTDSIWVILVGVYGWIGYLAHFGLLTLPILLLALQRNRSDISLITPGLTILLSALLIDFLPNAGMVPYVWMIAGALAGFVMQPAGVTERDVPRKQRRFRPVTAAPSWGIREVKSTPERSTLGGVDDRYGKR